MKLDSESLRIWTHLGQAYFHQDFDLEVAGDMFGYLQRIRSDLPPEDAQRLKALVKNALLELSSSELKGLWQRSESDMVFAKAKDAQRFFEGMADAFGPIK